MSELKDRRDVVPMSLRSGGRAAKRNGEKRYPKTVVLGAMTTRPLTMEIVCHLSAACGLYLTELDARVAEESFEGRVVTPCTNGGAKHWHVRLPGRFRRRRAETFQPFGDVAECPQPEKRRHDHEQLAQVHLEALLRTAPNDGFHDLLEVYVCSTGTHWHVGHDWSRLNGRTRPLTAPASRVREGGSDAVHGE